MESRADDRYRPTISVKRRIVHELVIQGRMKSFDQLEIVIELHHFFPAIVQGAVTGQNTDAPGTKELLMNSCYPVDDSRYADGIIRSCPERAFDAEPGCGRAIDI